MNTVKQEVVIGETNANDAVLISGISEHDRVYLSVPAGLENQSIQLLTEMNGKRNKKEASAKDPAVVSENLK
jgi:hypothetical protein